ncbi:MAG: NTP transferase domain-containing protein, partial [Candidatus Thioglobus sp.]
MKIIGIVPARMSASRFPGKPLHPILGRPMIEHVFERAMLYKKWSELMLATCDKEIADFGRKKGYPVVMTSNTHIRALDRVAEAVKKSDLNITDDDIVVNVQGDEPLLNPNVIREVVASGFDDNVFKTAVSPIFNNVNNSNEVKVALSFNNR